MEKYRKNKSTRREWFLFLFLLDIDCKALFSDYSPERDGG